jgi:hypothetical protein
MVRSRVRAAAIAVALAVSVTLASACSSQVEAPESPPSQDRSILQAFEGISFDYDPFETPAALAGSSKLVVEGQVERFDEGRELVVTGTDEPTGTTIVMVIGSPKVLIGDQATTTLIYIELPNPGTRAAEFYSDVIPVGTPVMVYINTAWDGSEPADESLKDASAGRPIGEELYSLTNPQSLVFQAGDSLVWPLLGISMKGSLTDAAPDGSIIAR